MQSVSLVVACACSICTQRAQAQEILFANGFECIVYADVDGDGFGNPSSTLPDCAPPAGSVLNAGDCNAGDAAIRPVDPDAPDLAFIDSKCDTIDGDIAGAVFVDATSGNEGFAGTMQAPRRTIAAGIALATAGNKDVYIASGAYPEAGVLASGVSV